MKICIFGGDRRNLHLSAALSAAGFPNDGFALGPEDFDLPALSSYAVVVGPVPFSRDGVTLYSPLTVRKVGTGEFLAALRPGATLFAGTLPPGAATPGVSCVDLAKDAQLYEKNILPTCEGILQILLNRIDFTLNASKLLLLGYGRIAKTLAPLLKNLGVNLAVYAAAPAEIEAFGGRFDRGDPADLSAYDLVVNTIPAVLLTRDRLATARPGIFILDVASAPGGIDRAASAELGIDFLAVGGIPGTKAPRTVAKAMMEAILRRLA